MIDDTYTLLEIFDYNYINTADFLIFIGAPFSRGSIIKRLEDLRVSDIHQYIDKALDIPYSSIKFFKEYNVITKRSRIRHSG